MSVVFKYNDSYGRADHRTSYLSRVSSTCCKLETTRTNSDNPRPGLKMYWEIRKKAKKDKSN